MKLGILAESLSAPLCVLLAAGVPAAEPAVPLSVVVEGTQFVVTLADGRVLRSPQLAGAVLTVAIGGKNVRLRIDAVEPDPGDPARGVRRSNDVWLHSFSVAGANGGWSNACDVGPYGRRQGFPLAGRARPDATIEPGGPGEFLLTCTGGAEAKCVRFGYHPWENLPSGAPMLPVYNACVHLVRADYAGDGSATTRNGQPIDIYDVYGIEAPAYDPAQQFEAGWNAQGGAVCVNHVRVKQNATLDAIAAHSPRLAGRVGAICTEAFARAHGAILLVRSPP
jgi:ADYC domain